MSLNLNKVVLAGRVTADIELKQTPSGVSVVSFTIAVNRRYVSKSTDAQAQQQADFIRVTAWRNTAEFICKYFRKGNPILIIGSIQTRNWTDTNGNKRYATDVVADEAQFVASRFDTEPSQSHSGNANLQNTPYSCEAGSFEECCDEELPF